MSASAPLETDPMHPISSTIMSNPAFLVLTPAVVCTLATILATMLRLRTRAAPRFARTCLFTLGLAPFLVYTALYAPILPNLLMRPGPLWADRLLDLFFVFVLVTPSYPIAFIIATVILIHASLNEEINWRGTPICTSLLLLHTLGLLHALRLSWTLS
jgi:hypothetical protein